jgi:L-lactate dehydrogenase complex protein LldE
LRDQGLEVDVPPAQTCCGQPAFNSGYWEDARAAARHFLAVFDPTEGYIVAPSGSCTMMVKHEYEVLFDSEPETRARLRTVADRVIELSAFLVDVLGVEDVGATYHGRVTYHASCHLSRGLGVTEAPHKLLCAVEGLDYVELPDVGRCCGFGGTFAVKMPDVSNAIVEDKIASIRATGADTLVACDAGCLMHIHGAMRRTGACPRVYHLAQLLAGDVE